MKKDTKTSLNNPVKKLRGLYYKNRQETLRRARESFKKLSMSQNEDRLSPL